MATHDYNIANADGATVRADINSVLEAIATNNSSSTAPSVTFPYMFWFDTSVSPAVLKQRNGANTAWVDFLSDGTVTTSTGEQTLVEALDGRVIYVGSVAELEALSPSDSQQARLGGGNDSGVFEFDSSNTTTPDGYEFIAPDSDPTGASGVWVRRPASFKGAVTNAAPRLITSKARERVSLKDVLGDNYTPSTGNASDTTAAIQSLYNDGFHLINLDFDSLWIDSTILFDPYTEIRGLAKGGFAAPTKIIQTVAGLSAFVARDQSSAGNVAANFSNIAINHADGAAGSGASAIDLLGCSHSIITDVSARGWTNAINMGQFESTSGGQYHTISGAEIANSVVGLMFRTAANSIRVIGGRIHSNTLGMQASSCNDVFVSTVIENNETGADLRDGTSGFYMFCRYEANGRDLTTNDILPDKAAVIMQSGAKGHTIEGFCSGASDKIIDLDGRNSVRAAKAAYAPPIGTPSQNLFANGALERDDDSDGLADFLTIPSGITAGMTVALDAATKLTGDNSQRVTVADTGTTRRDVQAVVRVTQGVPVTVTARVRTDITAGWNMRVGRTSGGTEYANSIIYDTGGWATLATTFTPTADIVYLTFYMSSSVAAGDQSTDVNLWIDSIDICHGLFGGNVGERNRVIPASGSTADRPTRVTQGEMYYDTSLDKPIWYRGPNWVDATGASV